MASYLQAALEENEKELQDLLKERQKIDHRIGKLVPSIRSLANLLENDSERIWHQVYIKDLLAGFRKPGLSQMILEVLFAYPEGLNAVQIRNALVSSGALDPKEYINPSASIHTTLRRLVDGREVEKKTKAGKKIFKIAAQPVQTPR